MNSEQFSTQRLRGYLEKDHFRLHPEVWRRLRDLHIDMQDALYVLQRGIITAEPEFDQRTREWRFTVEGETVDQKQLRIDFTFVEVDGVVVLTIMNEGP